MNKNSTKSCLKLLILIVSCILVFFVFVSPSNLNKSKYDVLQDVIYSRIGNPNYLQYHQIISNPTDVSYLINLINSRSEYAVSGATAFCVLPLNNSLYFDIGGRQGNILADNQLFFAIFSQVDSYYSCSDVFTDNSISVKHIGSVSELKSWYLIDITQYDRVVIGFISVIELVLSALLLFIDK